MFFVFPFCFYIFSEFSMYFSSNQKNCLGLFESLAPQLGIQGFSGIVRMSARGKHVIPRKVFHVTLTASTQAPNLQHWWTLSPPRPTPTLCRPASTCTPGPSPGVEAGAFSSFLINRKSYHCSFTKPDWNSLCAGLWPFQPCVSRTQYNDCPFAQLSIHHPSCLALFQKRLTSSQRLANRRHSTDISKWVSEWKHVSESLTELLHCRQEQGLDRGHGNPTTAPSAPQAPLWRWQVSRACVVDTYRAEKAISKARMIA